MFFYCLFSLLFLFVLFQVEKEVKEGEVSYTLNLGIYLEAGSSVNHETGLGPVVKSSSLATLTAIASVNQPSGFSM